MIMGVCLERYFVFGVYYGLNVFFFYIIIMCNCNVLEVICGNVS